MRSKGPLRNLLNTPALVVAGGILAVGPSRSRVLPHLLAAPISLYRIPGRSLETRETAQAGLKVFHYEQVLGTSLELKLAASPEHALAANGAVLAEIARLADILSAYQSESEFRRWQRSIGPVPISAELFEVLEQYDLWRLRTYGALNASAEVATRTWKTCSKENRLPSRSELDAAVQSMRNIHWQLDQARRTATHLTGAPLVLNSVAKAYIVDRAAAAALGSPGVSGVVVNIGGDLAVRGDLTEVVQIADPQADAENSPPVATLSIRNCAVATSGNYRRGVEIGGRHYSHILDPRNAEPVDHVLSSSVVAPTAPDAGALATAFSVMPIEESERLAFSLPGVEYLLIARDGRPVRSAGWSAHESPHARAASTSATVRVPPSAAQAASSKWDTSFELVIGLDLPRFQEVPYYRPYVAVWIEDKGGVPVRTVALWYDQPFWLHELRAWYRAYEARPAAEKPNLASITSATRPAGKYSFKWDGRDDQGNLVRAGSYTVCIEVVRQSADYEIVRQRMDFNGAPKEIQLAGKLEVSSVNLQYRKVRQR